MDMGERTDRLLVLAPATDSKRIQELFGLTVIVLDQDGKRSPSSSNERFDEHQVKKFAISTADTSLLQIAKKYLSCVQLLREGHSEKLYCRSADIYARLQEFRDHIERDTCAAVRFLGDAADERRKKKRRGMRVVEIGGTAECVSAALAMVHREFGKDCFANGDSALKLDSEDSSYDSDYENSDPVCSPGDGTAHDEVSRTVSDTLAAEFAEYVATFQAPSDAGEAYDDPTYTSRVEFALKLGYTERHVQIALQKLGPKPEQNELLAELIKLGATVSRDEQPAAQIHGSLGADDADHDAPWEYKADKAEPRPVVVDGSNVAMSHGNKEVFSCRGIRICVDWFRARGHKEVTVFVPMWRKEASRPDAIIRDQEILLDLERDGLLVFTPSRQMGGRRMACHDDRYILKLAMETDGIVVSNDNYRDLAAESPGFKKVIEERLLMFSFVNDRFMPPDDPLGRHGPSLDAFLRAQQQPSRPPSQKSSAELSTLPPPCPYGKKCTYGNKCKYYHPERGAYPHKSVSEQLAEQAKIHIQEVKSRGTRVHQDAEGHKLKAVLSSPLPCSSGALLKAPSKMPLTRTKSLVPTTGSSGLQQQDKNIVPSWTASFYGGGDHLSVATDLSSEPTKDEPCQVAAAPLHRKLERQLTFNPVYDPRLIHLTQVASGASAGSGSGHMPLSRHSSATGGTDILRPPPSTSPRGGTGAQQAGNHLPVTRIASAPDSYRQWRPVAMHHPMAHLQKMISTSDTQLHTMFSGALHHPPPVDYHGPMAYGYFQRHQQRFPAPLPTPAAPSKPLGSTCYEDQRYRLYYHLSSLFPEDQVRAAMEKCPHETDPQEICAVIFAMFPKPPPSSSVAQQSPSAGNIPPTLLQ